MNLLSAGSGNVTYADGSKYIGEWKEGKKHGKGEMNSANGDKFKYV